MDAFGSRLLRGFSRHQFGHELQLSVDRENHVPPRLRLLYLILALRYHPAPARPLKEQLARIPRQNNVI